MNEASIKRELCTYYVIMSKDRKYIISGRCYRLTMVQTNRVWRPRMFRTKERALQLFTQQYDWTLCWARELDVPRLKHGTKAEVAAHFKNLLDNYFDVVKISMTESCQIPSVSEKEE